MKKAQKKKDKTRNAELGNHSSQEKTQIVTQAIEELEEWLGKTVPIEEVVKLSKEKGLTKREVNETLKELKSSGLVYEPRDEFLTRNEVRVSLFEFGKRSAEIAKGTVIMGSDAKLSSELGEVGIDFNVHMFKAILKGAILDKDTSKIIIWLPKIHATKLFEDYIKRRVAVLQAEVEKAENMDGLLEAAEKVCSARLVISEKASELFIQEKARLLRIIEEKFGGTVKLGGEA